MDRLHESLAWLRALLRRDRGQTPRLDAGDFYLTGTRQADSLWVMSNQDKANQVAKLIEEMIDLKMRYHFRDQHSANLPPEEHQAELQKSLVDSNRLNAIRNTLPGAIDDLFKRESV
jgi:hypothetical protein